MIDRIGDIAGTPYTLRLEIKPCTSKNLELLGSLRMAHYMVYNFL